MAEETGGRMIGTNALQSAIDKFSRTVSQMSDTYGKVKPTAQKIGGIAQSAWTGKPSSIGSGGDDDESGNSGKTNGGHGGVAKGLGLAATFHAFADYGNKQLQQQLPMDEYVYQGSLGMSGNLASNQAALRRQAFGQNNQNLNAMATDPEDAAQMYTTLGQVAGTPLLNQTASGRTILGSTRMAATVNPYMTGTQTANVMSNVYSASTTLASQRLGLTTPRQIGTGQARSLSSVTSDIIQQSYMGRNPSFKELNAGFGQGGKLGLTLQNAGYSPQAIQEMQNIAKVQAQVRAHGGSQQQAEKLIDQASQGNTGAQKTLQDKYGVARTDAQGLKNLQASRTGRTSDTSSAFNKGISDSTDTLQKFSKAFTDFMDKTGLTDALGYGGGWASAVSSSLNGMGNLVAGGMGLKAGIGALKGGKSGGGLLKNLIGGGAEAAEGTGAMAGAAKFTNLGRFAPYVGKAGVVGAAAASVYGVYKSVATPEGKKQRKNISNNWDLWAQSGQESWIDKNVTRYTSPWVLGAADQITQLFGANKGGFKSRADRWAETHPWAAKQAQKKIDEQDSNQRSTTGDGQPGGKAGGAQKALAWAQSVSKRHLSYQWAGTGNPSWDCSGFMGSIQLVIDGKDPKHRIFSTHNFGTGGKHFAPKGWKYHQKAAFMIGVENGGAGGGHTAGTLLGHNVESNGGSYPHGGPRVDRNNARGYKNPLFHGDWWGYVPSGSNGGTADPGANQSSDTPEDTPDTNGSAGSGLGFGDEYGSSEEVSSLQTILDSGGAVSPPDTAKVDKPDTGNTQPKQGQDVKGADLKNKQQYYAYAKKEMAALGWSVSYNWPSLQKLWEGESNWNPKAENSSSGAYGIPQALPGSKMASEGKDWKTNASTQIRWGLKYIKGRPDYGNPHTAYAKWLSRSPHWYGTGTKNAQAVPGYAARKTLKKLKEMPKPAQGPHRILDKSALLSLSSKKSKNVDLNFTNGAIVLNIKSTDSEAIKQAAQDFVNEVQKLNVYQAVMG